MWSPPTPPHDDNDVYIDQTMFFLYEHVVMPETQLPPIYVKKECKKIKVEAITSMQQNYYLKNNIYCEQGFNFFWFPHFWWQNSSTERLRLIKGEVKCFAESCND